MTPPPITALARAAAALESAAPIMLDGDMARTVHEQTAQVRRAKDELAYALEAAVLRLSMVSEVLTAENHEVHLVVADEIERLRGLLDPNTATIAL